MVASFNVIYFIDYLAESTPARYTNNLKLIPELFVAEASFLFMGEFGRFFASGIKKPQRRGLAVSIGILSYQVASPVGCHRSEVVKLCALQPHLQPG